jgi:hypothetical protein
VRGLSCAVAFLSLGALTLPVAALAHLERPSFFPDPSRGHVPSYRTTGPALVVCKPDSRTRIERRLKGRLRQENLRLLAQCRYRHVQEAVNAAANGTRILVLPGVYREEPSRAQPYPDPACAGLEVPAAGWPTFVPGYAYQRRCPNAQNLIAIVGDANSDGTCDDKCNLQIEGTGARPSDVLIEGDRRKLNVIRADRADGIHLRNFTVQYSDFNNVYVIETNGFRFNRIVSRWSREYGFLTFTSDHGLYENLVTYGSGDAGIYPGSGPEGHCRRYGIEIRNVNSYGNTLGYSGTAGNGIYVHHSRFHHNAVGIATDSASPGHPGMPQDCAKWETNRIHSNNFHVFSDGRDAYCRRPVLERNPRVVCPSILVPVGTGLMIAGGNENLVRRNWIYDNWRNGVMLFWIHAVIRGEEDPAKAYDTSNGNRFVSNRVGVRPDGRRDPNGVDFWWDGEGRRNCWSRNTSARASAMRSDPARLPGCPGSAELRMPDPAKVRALLACARWDPARLADPPGCDWTRLPREPR